MNRAAARDRESGTVLVNVLAVLALCSAVLVTMTSVQDRSIARTRLYADAAQAMEIALGGEASVAAALRRDARTAPGIDHSGEAWAAINDREARIEGGIFTLAVFDAQGRFNLTNLRSGGLIATQTMARLSTLAADNPGLARVLPPEVEVALRERDYAALAYLAETLPGAAALFTELPVPTDVNINAAPEILLAVLFGNTVTARRIVALRDRRGHVTPSDLEALHVLLPPGIGFTSDFYKVRVDVRLGAARRRLDSLLWRRRNGLRVVVETVTREHGAATGEGPPRQ